MRPFYSDRTFSTSQIVEYTVSVYNTPHTINSLGMRFIPGSVLSGFGEGISFSGASLAQMQSHFDTYTVNGIESDGVAVEGRIPVLYQYWGRQAPLGVRTPGAVALRVSGSVKTSGSYGLAAIGRGAVKVFQNGSPILFGEITEDSPALTGLLSFTAGDDVDIFYWGINQEWGGLTFRVYTQDPGSGEDLDWDVLRETDILGAWWMDDGVALPTINLDEVMEVQIDQKLGEVVNARVLVSQATADGVFGWKFDSTLKQLRNVFTDEVVGLGNLISISGGYEGEVHPLFTGNVVDIVPTKDVVEILCKTADDRLTKQLSENLPDRLSYATFGYTNRQGVAEPVFGVPAYDHWPYEYLLRDMLWRSWVDPSLLRGTREVRRVGQSTSQNGSTLFSVRDLAGGHITVGRQVNYGNPEGLADKPEDDPYLTASELSNSLYTRIESLLDRIGYDFFVDGSGNFVCRPVNNPSSITQIAGGTQVVNPSAIGGTYRSYTGTGWTYNSGPILGSRIELVVGLRPTSGVVNVLVTRSEDGWTNSTNIDLSYDQETLYYDQRLRDDLSNITTYPVVEGQPYGTYTVVVTPLSGGGSTEFRLDALRVFEIDPVKPIPQFTLTNFSHVLEFSGKSNYTSIVNDAIVTGVRKNTITDSAKALDAIQAEYVVSRATDVNSIYNPNAVNYFGRKITAFLSDDSVGSQDLADWASRTLVSQYRLPEPDVQVRHTAIPNLELRDPVYIVDEHYDSLDPNVVRWVIGARLTLSPAKAEVNIEATPFPAVPSYEPREEIDLSLFNNKPVINLNITYPSLSGSGTVTNPQAGVPIASELETRSGSIAQDGSGYYLPLSPSIGTVSPGSELAVIENIRLSESPLYTDEYLKNNPYQRFYTISPSRLSLPFEMADGSAQYGPEGWGVEVGQTARFTYHEIAEVYSGLSPFYDPYYSELGVPELVRIQFDALVSGYYRVSVVDARGGDEVPIAWLTEPTTPEPDAESHWTYMEAGPTKEFLWDGVDNIGTWNKRQTEIYSWRQRGNFDQAENPLIGAGFYAANDQTTGMTHISGEVVSGTPAYPVGKYSQFFVKVEVVRTRDPAPLVARSDRANDMLDDSATPQSARFVYIHLPEPNKVTISISDWDYTAGDFSISSPGNSWTSTPDLDCTIRDKKPVRISMTAKPRVGAKFGNNVANTKVKVHRQVNLSSLILDQFVLFEGKPWNSKSTISEAKRITSRRQNLDDVVQVFADNSFTSGDKLVPWVFYPSQVEVEDEDIRYLDYLQLTEVPGWNPSPRPNEERSRMQLALMAYLFYLSVYTQDRSGRLVWAIDETFVDRSKILNNTETTKFPDLLNRHQRRTVYVRQWWDYEQLQARLSQFNVPVRYYGGYADAFDFHVTSTSINLYPTSPNNYYQNSTATAFSDPYSADLVSDGHLDFDGSGSVSRDLGNTTGTQSALGDWSWETEGGVLWVPNISRDFHPFYVIPPMGLVSYEDSGRRPWWMDNYWYAITNTKGTEEAKFDNWFALTYAYNQNNFTQFRLEPGRNVVDRFKDAVVHPNIVQIQRQDDIKHYENCRGAFSNGAGSSRDLIAVVGGDPYYLNTKLYRYFRMQVKPSENYKRRYYNDVSRRGWFFLTFRHTYNWESASLFPVDNVRALVPGAIDADVTQSSLKPYAYDLGAWVGWKDDHPSPIQQGTWAESGNCASIHWRNDRVRGLEPFGVYASHAGGSCQTDTTNQALSGEDLEYEYETNKNIFMQRTDIVYLFGGAQRFNGNYMPLAVGPRLPQTRRVLLATCLVNERRMAPV